MLKYHNAHPHNAKIDIYDIKSCIEEIIAISIEGNFVLIFSKTDISL